MKLKVYYRIFDYFAVHPPSTSKEVPVIIDAASEARKQQQMLFQTFQQIFQVEYY